MVLGLGRGRRVRFDVLGAEEENLQLLQFVMQKLELA